MRKRVVAISLVLVLLCTSTAFSVPQAALDYQKPLGLLGLVDDAMYEAAHVLFASIFAMPFIVGFGFLGGVPGAAAIALVSIILFAKNDGSIAQACLYDQYCNEGMSFSQAYEKASNAGLWWMLISFVLGMLGALPTLLSRVVFKKKFPLWQAFLMACGYSLLLGTIEASALQMHRTLGVEVAFCASLVFAWDAQCRIGRESD